MKTLDPSRLVFIDESGAATNLARRYGRAPIGQRACGTQPAGHYAQLTMIGALSLRGFVAPMTIEGAADTDVVVAYVEHVLVPQLEAGQSVVFDNLSPHKAPRVRQLIEAAGCRLLFLPPIRPTSTRSRKHGARSNRRCAAPPPVRAKHSMPPSSLPSRASPQATPPVGSATAATPRLRTDEPCALDPK